MAKGQSLSQVSDLAAPGPTGRAEIAILPAMRVFLCEFSTEPLVQIAVGLQERAGWDIAYWTGSKTMEDAVRAIAPDAVFHDNLLAIRGLPPVGRSDPPPALIDNALLRDLAPCEAIVLRMMGRMQAWPASFSYQDRETHYYRLIRQWKGILDHYALDAVIFPTTPHLVYDYIVYELCKLVGIRTIVMERTAFPARMLVMERFEEGCVALRTEFARLRDNDDSRPRLPSDMVGEMENLRSTGVAAHSANYRFKIQKMGLRAKDDDRPMLRLMHAMWRECLSGLYRARLRGPFGRPPRNYLKRAGRPMHESWMTLLEWERRRIGAMVYKERLRRDYERLAVTPGLDRPYVYVALHCQPERTTSPLAEFLNDQRLVIELVSRTLPEGWCVYVKEHPWQLHPNSRMQIDREPGYYADIAALPNVFLVPLRTSSSELTDQARAVVSVTGSAGFQAIMRGKPVLIFGHAWYKDCEGAFFAVDEPACRDALARIDSGYEISDSRLSAYLAALDASCAHGSLDPKIEDTCGIDLDEGARNIVDAIVALAESGAQAEGPRSAALS